MSKIGAGEIDLFEIDEQFGAEKFATDIMDQLAQGFGDNRKLFGSKTDVNHNSPSWFRLENSENVRSRLRIQPE